MDKYMDVRFDGVEKALAALINSIASFNPSTAQAHDLTAAQNELYAGLSRLETHQNNYLRIQQLRAETAGLDAQVKDTAALLWQTRKEIKSTQTTKYPAARPRYDYTYSDLLNYASRISRTSLPPPGVTNGVDLSVPAPTTTTMADGTVTGAEAQASATTDSQPLTNGAPDTPNNTAGANPGAAQTPSAAGAQDQPTPPTTALPAHMLPAVNLLEGAVFHPWPAEDKGRSGGLAACQRLADQGVNPRNHDPEAEERARKAAEEEQRRLAEREEDARRERARAAAEARQRERERVARDREAEMARRLSAGEAPPDAADAAAAAAARKQFQFAGGLDDDDDDDEDEDN